MDGSPWGRGLGLHMQVAGSPCVAACGAFSAAFRAVRFCVCCIHTDRPLRVCWLSSGRAQVPPGLISGDAFRIDTRVTDLPPGSIRSPMMLTGPALGEGTGVEASQLVGLEQPRAAIVWDRGIDC